MLNVEGCTELIELMPTGGCPLAQAEKAIYERFAIVCEYSADTDGAQLEDLVRTDIPAKGVWADTACRSNKNEDWLSRHGLVSHIRCKEPRGQSMPIHIKRANSARSKVRALVEHPFADQKHRMGLRIRTIGLARATIKIGMANMACNIRRLIYHETQLMKCA